MLVEPHLAPTIERLLWQSHHPQLALAGLEVEVVVTFSDALRCAHSQEGRLRIAEVNDVATEPHREADGMVRHVVDGIVGNDIILAVEPVHVNGCTEVVDGAAVVDVIAGDDVADGPGQPARHGLQPLALTSTDRGEVIRSEIQMRQADALGTSAHDFVTDDAVVRVVAVQPDGVTADLIEPAILDCAVLGILHVKCISARVGPVAIQIVRVLRDGVREDRQGLSEGQTVEPQVADRMPRGGPQLDEAIGHRHCHLVVPQRPFRRPEIELVGFRIKAPLPGLVEFFEQIFHVEAVPLRQLVPTGGKTPCHADEPLVMVDLTNRDEVAELGQTRYDEDLPLLRLSPASWEYTPLPAEGDRCRRLRRLRGFNERPAAIIRILRIQVRVPGANLALVVEEQLAE